MRMRTAFGAHGVPLRMSWLTPIATNSLCDFTRGAGRFVIALAAPALAYFSLVRLGAAVRAAPAAD